MAQFKSYKGNEVKINSLPLLFPATNSPPCRHHCNQIVCPSREILGRYKQ